MEHCSKVKGYSYVWKIEKFGELTDNFISSPYFKVDVLEDTEWRIQLYPFGYSDYNFLSIFISNNSNISNRPRFEVTISVLSTDVSSNVSKKVKGCVVKNKMFGFYCFMRREEVFSKRNVYLPQDTLTIQCYIVRKRDVNDITIGEEGKNHPQSESNIKCLNKDLLRLYLDEKFSDIKIGTLDRTFSVHKAVICARSPVFSAMFGSDTKEKKSGIVEITDLDSETVSLMLTFLYSDSVESLNQDQASKLYSAADKYEILPLKQRCSSVLKKSLSDANVCSTYILADMHQDVDLKAAVEDFIFVYASRIFKSSDWEAFMQSNHKLSAEIMHKLWIKHFDY